MFQLQVAQPRSGSRAPHLHPSTMKIHVPTLAEAWGQAKYKIDYFGIDMRLRFYSNSQNPRVIQTKLDSQPLLTLRTHPREDYWAQRRDVDIQERTQAQIDDVLDIYHESSDHEESVDHSPLVDVSGLLDSGEVESEKSALWYRGGSSDFGKLSRKKGLSSPTEALLQGLEFDPAGVDSEEVGSIALNPDETQERNPEIFKLHHETAPSTSNRQQMPWKVHSVSLSAARISTGSAGSSRESLLQTGIYSENRPNSAPMHLRSKPDVFAVSLRDAKAKWGRRRRK